MHHTQAQNIDDLRRIAARRLPRCVYEFVAGGAEDGRSLDGNRRAFERFQFWPRALRDITGRSQQVRVLGQTFQSPFGLAPTAAAGLCGVGADLVLARAARDAGVPFVLSTVSFEPLEAVARAADGGVLWFQLYMTSDRRAARSLADRASHAGYAALVLTVDLPVSPNREYNQHNGFAMPFRIVRQNVVDCLRHPRWLANVYLRARWQSGPMRFQNLDPRYAVVPADDQPDEPAVVRDAVTWDDVRWLRDLWSGPLFIKGILRPEDAVMAANLGVDGVIVSNHGGRALDGEVAPIEVVANVRAAVGRRTSVMLDSGIRRGSDIVTALALGADLVFAGRAPLYGMAAGGDAGVRHAIAILRSEVDRVLGMLGCRTVEELGPDVFWPSSMSAGMETAGRQRCDREACSESR